MCESSLRRAYANLLARTVSSSGNCARKHFRQCRLQHETVQSMVKTETVGTDVGTAVKYVGTVETVGTVREKNHV